MSVVVPSAYLAQQRGDNEAVGVTQAFLGVIDTDGIVANPESMVASLRRIFLPGAR